MKAVSGKRMTKILQSKGWMLARISGSHHIYVSPLHPFRITVPVHGNQDLKLGLQRAIMKMASIEEHEL